MLIFEATEPGFPTDQAVRIFVEFEALDGAAQARCVWQGWCGGIPGAAGTPHPCSRARRDLAACLPTTSPRLPPPAAPLPAPQALADLQGRFFGGRQVQARYFGEARFARRELAPRAEEVRR